MKHVLVVGSANMDLVMQTGRLPRPGETIMGNHFMTARGGKGANQAVAAARLGGRVRFLAAVGDDAFGALQREGLEQEGILMDVLIRRPDLPTGAAMILINDDGENIIVVAPGANASLSPDDIRASAAQFAQADALVCQLEIPLETVRAALRLARENKVFSVLDTGAATPEAASLAAEADLVSPNETEAETLTGIPVDSLDSARAAAQWLADRGAAHVVMKLGARGCLYLGDGELYLPSFEVEARDPTGAGDAFTAALALAWNRLPLEPALRFANAAGALATTIAGAQPSMPDFDTVMQFLTERNAGVQWPAD